MHLRCVAFIGLGTMGGPMAHNLLKSGFALRVFDIEPKAMDALSSAGATPASSPSDAARGSDCVITMLPNGEDVEEAMFGAAGAAGRPGGGRPFIGHQTPAASDTRPYPSHAAQARRPTAARP